ncbi:MULTISPECIES: hypothetical protein [Paraburkholderia]|uniref:Uncharacterized protein n=1 Tax=Paraburkholderia madseniana TaxID=2599607 RepID=A0AAP5BNN7_9BURK|nr:MULTISPECIES: hypothetical protein [Paraburkholderia]MCX4151514.1 hypothetical protein [Paraburkholderia madseniana]MDN7154445.1 hypothetical protein [Paraburkholderia sp. WS6]MDQ6413327.1 hypothetical protein [Paraburkholderia madseniana]
MQEIDTQFGTVSIVNEPAYSFDSKDNVRTYALEVLLTRDQPTSVHGIALNATGIVVVGADGGCSSVHDRSALVLNDKLYLAVGDHAACLSLSSPHGLVWSTRVDMATCFGLYWESSRGFLISHGELEISRLSLEGDLVWQASGADVFSEGFRLLPGYIEAVDFNGSVYRLDYVTGEVLVS